MYISLNQIYLDCGKQRTKARRNRLRLYLVEGMDLKGFEWIVYG